MKLLGGCGLAGCLGLLVVGAIVLVVVLVASSSTSSSSGPTSSGPSRAPSSGSLRSMVRSQIGPFRLVEVAGRPTGLPNQLVAGATDSLALSYSGKGDAVGHVMLAFSSSGVSASRLDLFKCNVTTRDVKNRDGRVIGRLCVSLGNDGKHVAVWTNSNLLFVAVSTPSSTAEFYSNAPY